ncbi:maleylpyruvate isomerase family mycothiol-dependent enzyme [Streptomyces paludis]|uniref:Maleylpyruvate isomerase family mycothiol-dependent enzyme n=1 Tax=Streptomyces paludis TaxID=2282738 RepID=A0A345I1C1_9ACTN|nr:maleylpyruvate isomerase family mycothiol-dependent enzyme [Streptomyces paludis]AXG82745.1 maleylpyruvate isomerase family mycothiol-dependent enzyme [Streptomyces paludis]
MTETTVLLSLIEDRSAALRDAVATALDLDARVPGCPEWSLRQLVEHVGGVQRFWAAVVAAGPADQPPTKAVVGETDPAWNLLDWWGESTALLLSALLAADPRQGCWTWWGASGAPQTVAAVARHQVQEVAVHAYDAQEAASGRPRPIPGPVAVDGVDEFLTVVVGSSGPWPRRSARIVLCAEEGPSWTLGLTRSERSVVAPGVIEADTTAVVRGPASDLLLALYGRIPVDYLAVEGDRAAVAALMS